MKHAPNRLTWHYWKIYPATFDSIEDVLTEVIGPLASERSEQWERWFYLRYMDSIGAHIRFRALVTAEEADLLEGLRPRLLNALHHPHRPKTVTVHTAVTPPSLLGHLTAPGVPHISSDLYEPEASKWGDATGQARAEELFQTSSQCALDLLDTQPLVPITRLAVGILFVREILDMQGFTPEQRTSFLNTHFAWWSGANTPRGGLLGAAARTSADQFSAEVSAMLANKEFLATTRKPIESFTGSLRTYLTGAKHDRKPAFLVFHQLHLMLNRLGISPYEESVVSLLT